MTEPSGVEAADEDDAAEIVFPSGKSTIEGDARRPRSKDGKKNVAKGKYNVKQRSPPRRRKATTATEPSQTPLQSGISKLVEASVRYHPEKDRVLKQGFAGEGLTPPELRDMLRRLFNVKLTEPELSAVFAHFVPDGGMELDGNTFIIHFIQMGQTERDRRRVERLELERQHLEQLQLAEAELLNPPDPAEALNHLKPDVTWEPEDKASAMAMITEAAVAYDKTSPASFSLDAFEGATMTPLVFREQLRRVFNIKLSPPQLAAVMSSFDKDNDGSINCAEFLLQFFLTGFQHHDRSRCVTRTSTRRSRWMSMRFCRLPEREAICPSFTRAETHDDEKQVDYNYTGDEQARGLAKLVEAAVAYDATGPASLGLGAFQGHNMPPHVFREQLRKVFNIRLTPAELGGVMHRFDKDGDGTVDVVEFTKTFFKMGFDEREKRARERREAEARREAIKREEEARRRREEQKKNALKLNSSYSEEHHESAMVKITKAAARYDKNHPSAVSLDAFDGAQMEPHVFREQLKRAFAIKLTPPELGAAICAFDKDGDGCISCPEFLRTFFRLGFEAKAEKETKRRRRDRKMAGKAAEEAAEKEREIAWRAALKVSDSFDENDRESAMEKISDAASRYDKNHPSCLGLDAFEGALMPPHIFKEQLKRVFGLKLSPGELGAMMQEFDKDGDGTVNCSEFLLTFFRIGFEGRNKALRRRREEEAARARRMEQEENRRYLEAERKRLQDALAPYTEKDLDDTLDMLIEAASRYDRRQLGPAGLKAWEVKFMTPTELKTALQRTFDIRLSPPQLGAVAHLFGIGGDSADAHVCDGVFAPPMQIEVLEFLTTFFKISTVAKRLAARSDSTAKLDEYRAALKERLAQQEEVRRTLKAMRDNPPKRAFTVDSGLKRATHKGGKGGTGGGGRTMDPVERIRFQVTRARATNRLDLSTWANRKKGDFLLGRVPRTVWHLTGLKELWLTNNDIQMLPPQIRDLRNLRILGVGRNRISRLPGELGLLPDLVHIFAENNWLSTLPKELATCRNLRELRLDGNQFSRLPDCVQELRGLEVLDLRGNSIDALPPDLKFLRSLLELDLEGNPIGPEIPEVLFALVNLSRLNLAGTKIGPAQGAQLEEKLRLDSLTVNADAFAAAAPGDASPSEEMPAPSAELEQQAESQTTTAVGGFQAIPGRRCISRPTSVPDHRLPEIKDNASGMPAFSTKRLPGLDVVPSDAKAMMRAKAGKTRTARFGAGGGDTNTYTMRAGQKEGATPGSSSVVPKGVGTASRVVAAATICG
ncbi:unnamed protein product [Scytosiphon promiscuus]